MRPRPSLTLQTGTVSDLIINSISLQPLLFGAVMNLRHVTRYETPAKERVLWLIGTVLAML